MSLGQNESSSRIEPSSKNTANGPDDLSKLAATQGSKIDDALSELQRDLSGEKDGRKEERFVWSLVCVVLFDVIIAPQMGWNITWILVFEFIFIFVFGRICGVDYIYEETQKAIDTVARVRALRQAAGGARRRRPKKDESPK